MIKINNLLRVYDMKPVLNNIDIEILDGEFVAITGKSGCGKTTLLNIIGLIDNKYSGTYYFESIKNPNIMRKSGANILRNRIGFIFQNFALIDNMTVKKNFKIVEKYNKSDITIEKALQLVGLEDTINKKVYKLSGGEQQRIAIAKIMCKGCDVILADEPTGSLDSKNRDIVLDILEQMNREGKTIIVVTHDQNVVKRASREIKLGD
ncbi:MAG: ABC transporter ATP-binding protein [Bacilli bacterium]